jgi:hypothetical protein
VKQLKETTMSQRTKITSFILAFLFLGSLTTLSAQEMKKPALHPGDVVPYQVKLEGPNAEKFTSASIVVQLKSPPDPGQVALQQNFGASAERMPDGVFHVNLKIPEYAASGEYGVSAIVMTRDGVIRYIYSQGELSIPPLNVRSDTQFQKPRITVTQRP